jgi:hypothetical protein
MLLVVVVVDDGSSFRFLAACPGTAGTGCAVAGGVNFFFRWG